MLRWHKLRPLQAMAAALFFKHKRLMLVLPRQYGGKTELGCQLGVDYISHGTTKKPAMFLAKDRPSAKKATREKYERLAPSEIFSVNTEQIYHKKNRPATLYIQSVDKDPDRIRGGTYGFVHWSEVAFSKIEKGETIISVFDKIVQPTLSLLDGYALLETTLNGKNDFFTLWEDYERYGFHRLKISLSDMVKLGLVSVEEYERIRATTHPDVFRQEYECEWVSFSGRMYPEFSEEETVDPEMPYPESWQNMIFAIDWGYHLSATCVLYAYVLDGVLCIFDEHYEHKEMPIVSSEAIDKMKRKLNCRTAGVGDHDPANNEELIRRGIEVANAEKINVRGARMQIKEALYFGLIRIHPRCVNLIRELLAATWHPKKEDELDETQDTVGHFDAEAALRYLIRMFAETEATAPDYNPHAAYDQASALAHEITRGTV